MTVGIKTVGKAAAERAAGFGPGRMRAFGAAMVTGTATAVLTYRVLRNERLLGEVKPKGEG
jgi:hypothetical protein